MAATAFRFAHAHDEPSRRRSDASYLLQSGGALKAPSSPRLGRALQRHLLPHAQNATAGRRTGTATYAYRLCRKSEGKNLTEECFERGHLGFTNDTSWIQYGNKTSNRTAINAVRTSSGTGFGHSGGHFKTDEKTDGGLAF